MKTKFRISRILSLAALVLALPADAATKKMLVLTQAKTFTHNPVKRPAPDQLCLVEQTLKDIGEKSGLFETVNSQDSIAALTRENLAKFDAVFFYTQGVVVPAGEPREALTDFVKSGKAFLGSHSATDTFHGNGGFPGYVQMINGNFAGHPWNAGNTCTFVNHEPSHPTVKMFPAEFQWKDEIYQYVNFDPKSVRVLISLDMSKTSPKMPYHVPVCWVREFGSGRLFYTNLGHNDATWKDAKFHDHLIAGFRWASKLDNGPATPNPAVQAAEYVKGVAVVAAAAAKKDWEPIAAKAAKKSADAVWFAKLVADVEAWRKVPTPDAKKASPEDVQSAAAKKSDLLAALLAHIEK